MDISDFAARNQNAPPSRLGQRYDAGRFLPESGNTVVCHLDRSHPAHQAVLTARARMQALPEANKFLFTPVASLHMTVFEGVIETRRIPGAWPAPLALDTSVDAVTDHLMTRLSGLPSLPGFAVRPVGLLPTGLALDGVTAADQAALQAARAALTKPFQYRHADHDSYGFHMTFAYPLDWLSDAATAVWQAECPAILADLTAAVPMLPLRSPAFCRFADMTHFEELSSSASDPNAGLSQHGPFRPLNGLLQHEFLPRPGGQNQKTHVQYHH